VLSWLLLLAGCAVAITAGLRAVAAGSPLVSGGSVDRPGLALALVAVLFMLLSALVE